jgi:BCD family chlorophyll transporter-like MFS transporter
MVAVLIGMIFVALLGTWRRSGQSMKSMRRWTVGGCVASALALLSLTAASMHAGTWPLQSSVMALGFANGVFAVAAIGSMMTLAGEGQQHQEGLRMGLWGAAQAIAFGLGGFMGTMASDLAQWLLADSRLSLCLGILQFRPCFLLYRHGWRFACPHLPAKTPPATRTKTLL